MDWVISKIVEKIGTIEQSIKAFLNFFAFSNTSYSFFLEDLEATGPLGNELTIKMNQSDVGLEVNKSQLLQLLEEDGQIFECELRVKLFEKDQFIVVVRDGDILDILGNGPKPSEAQIGPYQDLDLSCYAPFY
jgi:hypothetical protein